MKLLRSLVFRMSTCLDLRRLYLCPFTYAGICSDTYSWLRSTMELTTRLSRISILGSFETDLRPQCVCLHNKIRWCKSPPFNTMCRYILLIVHSNQTIDICNLVDTLSFTDEFYTVRFIIGLWRSVVSDSLSSSLCLSTSLSVALRFTYHQVTQQKQTLNHSKPGIL